MLRSPLTRKLALTAGAATVVAGVWVGATAAQAGTISGTLYRDPSSSAAKWVAANPGDSRTPVIRDRIASQPASHWLSTVNLGTVGSEVSTYVGGAAAVGQIPVLTVYGIPNRDCGGASAGGASDLTQYQNWISDIAGALGGHTTIIVLEPDAIALQTCLSASDITARDNALHTATTTLKAAGAKVYLDGGHSAWNTAADQAGRLAAAGVADADGFFTNVSNFNSTSNEAAYGRSVIADLANLGAPNKHQVIDTSRNGGASGDWCGDDNTDRRIGQYPTTDTGDANIDAYLWVKPPGEADGCVYAAGSFQPSLAYSLASSATNPPSSTPTTAPTTTPTTAPTTTPPTTPPTTAPTTAPPASGTCAATYRTTSSWQGGFQGEVTITAGDAAISSWTVTWTLAGGQSISQAWNGTLTTSGSTATVRNLSWNGTLAAHATTTFGFLANGTATTPALTCA